MANNQIKLLRSQFEVRYTPILDFKNLYKKLVAPFLHLCDFSISNQDGLQEYIVLSFRDEKYNIDFRWDRIILITEGDREDLELPTGPSNILFQLFNALKMLDEFGKVRNALLADAALLVVDQELSAIKRKYKEKYLSALPNLRFTSHVEDLAIRAEYVSDSETFKFGFGPFDPKKDVTTFNLAPISKKLDSEVSDLRGILLDSLYYETVNDASLDTIKRFRRAIRLRFNEISI